MEVDRLPKSAELHAERRHYIGDAGRVVTLRLGRRT